VLWRQGTFILSFSILYLILSRVEIRADVFMGDFPLMSPQERFISNGTERVVVSILSVSPGVYFEPSGDRSTGHLSAARLSRPAGHGRLEIDRAGPCRRPDRDPQAQAESSTVCSGAGMDTLGFLERSASTSRCGANPKGLHTPMTDRSSLHLPKLRPCEPPR